MRNFGLLYVQFLFLKPSEYIRYENSAFSMKNMRVFLT